MTETSAPYPDHLASPVAAETLQSPEALMTGLVSRVERGLVELHVPPRDKRDWGWCNFVPDAFNYCALQDGEEQGYTIAARKYQARDLHFVAAGITREHPEYINTWRTVFSHGFNIAEINGQAYLADLTFAQFMGDEGYIEQPVTGKQSGIGNDNQLAQALLHQGFVPLNDDTLREYVRLTTTDPQPGYLGQVSVDMLSRVAPLPFDPNPEENELMGQVPSAYQH